MKGDARQKLKFHDSVFVHDCAQIEQTVYVINTQWWINATFQYIIGCMMKF